MANSYTRRINLYINDKEVKNDIQSIQKEFYKANTELKKMEVGSKEYNTQLAKVGKLKSILNDHTKSLSASASGTNKFSQAINSIPGPIGGAIQGIKGLGKSLLTLAMNPVGAVITAIVGAVFLLVKAFKSTDDGATKLAGIMKGMSNVFDIVLDRVDTFRQGLGKLLKLDFKGFKESSKEAFSGAANSINEAVKAGIEYENTMDAIKDREAASLIRTAKLRTEIENLKNAAKDQTLTQKERLEANEAAMKKEMELNEIEKQFVQERTNAELKNLAAKIQMQGKSLEEREAMINKWLEYDDREVVSMMEKDKAFGDFYNKNEDAFQNLQKMKADEHAKDAELATKTRRLQSELSGFKVALAKEDEQKQDELRKKSIEALELGHQQEKLSLKEQYIGKEEMQAEYNARMLANEIAFASAKLEITTGERERITIQQQLVDLEYQYKQAVEEALIPMLQKKELTTDMNLATFESNKLTEISTAKANEATKAQQDLNAQLQGNAQRYQQAIGIISQGVYDMASGSEDAMKTFAKAMLKFALEQLKIQAQIAAAGATVQSLSQPDSIATFGATGLVRAAIIVGLIEAAFAGLNALVDSFDVGGFTASAGSDSKPVGVVHANEWVASAPLLRNPETRKHIDYLEQKQRGYHPQFNTGSIIQATSLRGFQVGGHTGNGNSPYPTFQETAEMIVKGVQVGQTAAILAGGKLEAALTNMSNAANKLAEKEVVVNANEVFAKKQQYDSNIQSSNF